MIADFLEPSLDLLREEYVLVQAWKKTSSYIRYHNWYSDTVELDRVAVDLPRFLAELADRLKSPEGWSNDPLRIVPAPKSQAWQVTQKAGTKVWGPVKRSATAAKRRPLAHVSIKDQVAATALMLCLASRVETSQGDPRVSIENARARETVVSYGNRLFCERVGAALRHPWGSQKLYRAYYEDYRRFLLRPTVAAHAAAVVANARVVIVHSDLRQFYDRVRPALLSAKLARITRQVDDPTFFVLARRLLNWEWDAKDSKIVSSYQKEADLSDFSSVALPQGLVAAGFFANVALFDFDQGLREAFTQEIKPGIRLEDASRYVDDLRIVTTIGSNTSLPEVEQLVTEWLQELLDRHAPGLQPSRDKTTAAAFRGDERPLVQQSRKMARIQRAISGGFDAIGGEEILDAVQGLIRSQQRYSARRTTDEGWQFAPIPDVRDETVARFAAARYRTTFRSLRPLLSTSDEAGADALREEQEADPRPASVARTQSELDEEAKAFALGLIETWVQDPSNVRLLRIGLDLWPAADVLQGVLDLLRPFIGKGTRPTASRLVAWYCLSEIFRAGATETGFVEDGECLPLKIDISAYRAVLRNEAAMLATRPPGSMPWYLRQQVLLFLAANRAPEPLAIALRSSPETEHYVQLIKFLRGENNRVSSIEHAILAILSRRSFFSQEESIELALREFTVANLEQIAERDPSFATEILASKPDLSERISPRLRDDLSVSQNVGSDGWIPLSRLVLQSEPNGPLRNELVILRFSSRFLSVLSAMRYDDAITPSDVLLKLSTSGSSGLPEIEEVKIIASRVASAGSMYQPPNWCPTDERWRFHLGYLLRFILTARADFTKAVRKPHWKETIPIYRTPDSHWYQRLYGLFNRQSAFGGDWLPISEWIELFLLALLKWPGCRVSETFDPVRKGLDAARSEIDDRIRMLLGKYGRSSDVLVLPLKAPWVRTLTVSRPLRACVVQTVIPNQESFTASDLTLSASTIRREHRRHLSSALAAIERMLDLRETHTTREGRLDWLLLPELSVHPRDINTHLVPFARTHKTIILAGLTYEELMPGKPLTNSAIWVIPLWSPEHGWEVITRRQGKQHLAHEEQGFNTHGAVIQGFRPCQWLVGYEWSRTDKPLWLTASVCYDATDVRLAADLRDHSDVFAIPALNQDVGTFDQMALALHYHMFQMIIVANNGRFGGSNAYAPYREPYVRQVFHLHGQPQATVAFLEIDDIGAFINRRAEAKNLASSPASAGHGPIRWKFPPASV
ncbi:MAG TPA: RNA-directed DNA polymerase [Candidatus Angelobacter sp.]|nr:RNA-directed DNA polymerase [Candidatus Angelobacter sp.]